MHTSKHSTYTHIRVCCTSVCVCVLCCSYVVFGLCVCVLHAYVHTNINIHGSCRFSFCFLFAGSFRKPRTSTQHRPTSNCIIFIRTYVHIMYMGMYSAQQCRESGVGGQRRRYGSNRAQHTPPRRICGCAKSCYPSPLRQRISAR